MASIEIISILICILLLCGFCKRNAKKWPPSGLVGSLFFNFHQIFDKCTESLQRNNGTLVFNGSRFYPLDILMTCDPANVQHVLRTNFANFLKGDNSRKIFDVFGSILFNADLDEWRIHRKLVNILFSDPQFQQTNSKNSRDVIVKGLFPVFDYMSENGLVVDLQDLFGRLMYDMSSLMSTGYNPATLRVGFPTDAFANALDEATRLFLLRIFLPEVLWKVQRWLGIGPEKSWSNTIQVVDEVAANIIQKKQDELSKCDESNCDREEDLDVLKFCLTSDEVAGANLPKSATRDAVVGFTFAARDTTAVVLSWFFWILHKNPIVKSKIMEELTTQISVPTAPNSLEILDIEKLNNLVYLHGALCETLRLFPPVPLTRRVSVKPDILPSGHRVNTNTTILLCSYAMGRMESIWGEDCLEIKPERWISEEGKVRVEASNKFVAFSTGPRICPGKELAFSRLKAVIATIIHNYHVQVVEGQEVTHVISSLLYIKNGLKVRITKRWM